MKFGVKQERFQYKFSLGGCLFSCYLAFLLLAGFWKRGGSLYRGYVMFSQGYKYLRNLEQDGGKVE